jgi:replicative superfamily II helicase
MDELVPLGIPPEIVDIWKREESEHLLPVQELAVREGGALTGQNLLVVAPTSSGKTFIGEMAAVQKSLQRVGSIFLVPYKALAEEKYLDFCEKYEAYGLRVVISSGDRREFDEDIRLGTYGIALLTYEKMAGLLVAAPELLTACGLVVVDEVQMMMDKQRGARLELLLTKIRQVRPELQIIALSAVLDELNGLESWLGCQVVTVTERPIELREGTHLPSGQYRYREWNTKRSGEEKLPAWPSGDREMALNTLVVHLVNTDEQVLIFRNTVNLSEETAFRIATGMVAGRPAVKSLSLLGDVDDTAVKAKLQECLRRGVAFHNSDLTAEERFIVERGFRNGEIRVVCSTPTLAMGVNLPAKTVIIPDTTEWVGRNQEPLPVGTYRNMAGRAGRYAFNDEFGRSILLASTPHDRDSYERMYIYGQPEAFSSRLAASPFELQVLDLVTTRLCTHEDNLVDFLRNTFAGFRSWSDPGSQTELRRLVANAVQRCCDEGLMMRGARGRLTATRLGEICVSKGFSIDSFVVLVDWLRGKDLPPLLDTLFRGILTDEAMQVRFPFSTQEFRRGIYLGNVGPFSQSEDVTEFLGRWGIQDATYETGKKIKMLLAAHEWVSGRRTREVERAFQVGAGTLRNMGAQLSWVMDVMSAIAAEVGTSPSLGRELAQLSERLAHGVTADGLFLARLGVAGLGRDGIWRLVAAGFASEDAILDAPAGAFQGILQSRVAERLRGAIERRVANTLERRKREHIRRVEAIHGDGQVVRNLYEREGEKLERVIADLFRPPFYDGLCERITKQREGEPDLLLHTGNGPLAVQITAREEGQVKMKKTVEVVGQSARFRPSGYLVIGRPEFHSLALQAARDHASAGTNFKLITVTDLSEIYIRVLEGRLDAPRVAQILTREVGVVDREAIERFST